MKHSATYSPDDNKLRIYPGERLDKETYERARAVGFRWAPKQELFVCPAWGPAAEDFALELCGEIDDEDKSLVERAEERAERFEEYHEKRTEDAERAHAEVNRVAQRFEGGQPILVGHHSEKRARKDAERIQNGMRRAVQLFDTASYWERRAKGAIRSAKYKERADVRHRRIKVLEAERRKCGRSREEAMALLKMWEPALVDGGMDRDRALALAGAGRGWNVWSDLSDAKITVREAAERVTAGATRSCEHAERWIAHLDNRIAYECAMLDEQGGIPAAKFAGDVEVGGQVLGRWGWGVVTKVTKKDGVLLSVTTRGRHGRMVDGVEEIRDYRPPAPGDAEKVRAATATGPLVNYPGEGFRHITKAEWEKFAKWTDQGRAHRVKASERHGAHRLRMVPREGRPYYDQVGAFIVDQKRVDPPPPAGERPALPAPVLEAPASPPRAPRVTPPDPAAPLREALRAGVRVVVADQLFPTPEPLARRMAEAADIQPHHRVLEPSAGTGTLIKAIGRCASVTAVEVNLALVEVLLKTCEGARCADFLQLDPEKLGTFDVVLMNPPFAHGADVAHVLHALKFLRDGGVLVALVANGPRQREVLKPLVEARRGTWEDLPDGSFSEQGTNVRVAMLVVRKLRTRGRAA